ncbi:MAG: class I SAM-dependent methyltransferase [Candidatus Woesearchaeota archaeon]
MFSDFEKKFLSNRSKKGIYTDLEKFLKNNYKKGHRLLDVGAGTGIYSKLAKKIGYEVYAIDYNPEICKFKEIKILFCDLNTQKLPFLDNYFDVVIMTEVIEHLYNTGFILSEINRVLKEKGILYLTTPNLANLKNKLWFLFFSYFITHKKNPGLGDHINHITPLFLKYFLERTNFQKIRISYLNSFFPFTKIKLPNSEFFSDTVKLIAYKK